MEERNETIFASRCEPGHVDCRLSRSRVAQAPPDPAAYCKDHPTEMKCVGFFGSTAKFSSQSGNVGSTQSTASNSRYIVFIHAGGSGPRDAAQRVSKDLQGRGFTVRGVDDAIDTEGGPGVDYFVDQDKSTAQAVADIVNGLLPQPNPAPLKPRLQKVTNPAGFLGVWLYKKQ